MNQKHEATPERIVLFVSALQEYSKSKLFFPATLQMLIESVAATNNRQDFESAIFNAKVAVRTQEVMRRIGSNADGFDKLSAEFQSSVEKTSTLLKEILKGSGQEKQADFNRSFFSMSPESFTERMKLFSDLAWVKNWLVDGKNPPI